MAVRATTAPRRRQTPRPPGDRPGRLPHPGRAGL
jgi:hypothetical protein